MNTAKKEEEEKRNHDAEPTAVGSSADSKRFPTDFHRGSRPHCRQWNRLSRTRAAASICSPRIGPMRRRFFYDRRRRVCFIVPQPRHARARHGARALESGPRRKSRSSRARTALSGRAAERRRRTRLYLREFRGSVQIAGSGPIGSNGLAQPPAISSLPSRVYEEIEEDCELIGKFGGRRLWGWRKWIIRLSMWWAWHGNYAPYKYDLPALQWPLGSVSPMIIPIRPYFWWLHSPSDTAGTSNIDFVVFSAALAGDGTYFSAALVSPQLSANEFMGLICGVYDAKGARGFVPGGSSLHNCMSGHGPRRRHVRQGIRPPTPRFPSALPTPWPFHVSSLEAC